VSGFTKRSIIGATTTLDIFIYDIFTGRSSTGIASAYSVLTLLLVAFVMILWFLSSRAELNAHLLIILAVIQASSSEVCTSSLHGRGDCSNIY
jgi:hypothetical protein